MKKFIKGCGFLAVLGFAGCIGLAMLTDTTPDEEATLVWGTPAAGTIAKGEYGEIQGRAISFTGTRAADEITINNEFIDPIPGPILWVDAKFKNTSNESGNFLFSQMKLVDTQGREYTEVTDGAYLLFREESGLPARADDYFPGEEKVEALAFRVAPDAQPVYIEWKGKKFSLEP